MNVKLLIASHKFYETPDDEIYMPIFVGSVNKNNIENFTRDDSGDNISEKNPYYCELTGLYWGWKNANFDFLGLVHYRRYFAGTLNFKINNKNKKILCTKDIINFKNDTVYLPKKRNYYIETLYSHYKHTMYIEPLDKAGEIILEKYPDYYKEFELLKKRRKAHMFNMFIMPKDILNSYCEWLFDILQNLEQKVDSTKYTPFHARFYGRVSELLLDVWINTNHIKYKEIPVVSLEKTNWLKKGFSFIRAKISKKKYEKSF